VPGVNRAGSDLGPVAVVTGSSRGLGAGMAREFAARGLRLGLCARSRPEPPVERGVLVASVDVSDAAAVDGFAAAVVERFGRIDLWANNAGVLAPIGPVADASPGALRTHVETNVLGVMYGSAAFARHVRARPGDGVLVNLTSGAATNPYEGWAAYCASKAAVDMFTEVVAREGRRDGLWAFALAPGHVDTDMQALIRSSPPEALPAVGRFRQVFEEDRFNSPAWVARFILDRLVERTASPERSGAPKDVRLRVPDEG
jgi:benzil reductase ((S)-benzoin forming)